MRSRRAWSRSFGLSTSPGALSARVWHLVNFPAGTDIAQLRAQIGALDREVRRLALHQEQQQAHNDARTDGRETDGADAQPP